MTQQSDCCGTTHGGEIEVRSSSAGIRPLEVLEGMGTSFPNSWHYDPEHYRKELDVFWYSMWVFACRSEEVASARDYKVVTIGEQNIVIARDLKGRVRAFHNTCRHRGSILCTNEQGRFEGGSIVCPYHAWTYSLEGDLIATPHQLESADFDMKDYSLYDVAVGEWGGLVFVNLAGDRAEPLEDALGDAPERLKKLPPGRPAPRLPVCGGPEGELEALVRELHGVLPLPLGAPGTDQPGADLREGTCRRAAGPGVGAVRRRVDDSCGRGHHTRRHDVDDGRKSQRPADQRTHRTGTYASGQRHGAAAEPVSERPPRLRPHAAAAADRAEHAQLTWDYLFEPETMEREGFDAKKAYELWHITNLQDAQNVEWQQAGIEGGHKVHGRSVFAIQETGPNAFNEWVQEKMNGGGQSEL